MNIHKASDFRITPRFEFSLPKLINYAGEIPLSTVDWPGVASHVIFLNGCPLKCCQCHNAQIREVTNMVDIDYVMRNIVDNKTFINHVVVSGGEPLAQPTACKLIIEACHDRGLKVALETSGCLPLVEGFDRVMLDIKTTLKRSVYDSYVGLDGAWGHIILNLGRMDHKTSEIRIVLFPNTDIDIPTLRVLRSFPIRISLGRTIGPLPRADLLNFAHQLNMELTGGEGNMQVDKGWVLLNDPV